MQQGLVGDRCLAIAVRILREIDLAEDAVQAALITAWTELRTLRDPSRFEPWLHRILTNACYAEARRRRRWSEGPRILPVEGVHGPDDEVGARMGPFERCADTAPYVVDGATGLIAADGCNSAAVTTDGRGYLFRLYTSGDDPSLSVTYDRAWFEEVLATAQLHPEDAVGAAPSASP